MSRGSAYSPRTVISSDRALAWLTSRRRLTVGRGADDRPSLGFGLRPRVTGGAGSPMLFTDLTVLRH
ncbi:hypothetical protein H480_25790 [Amycolatopsis vancoresmycina DSM 44592]|uniref:Uncharacterized protein n=1 Tax=Amycolatopsis vancoresmycina DSM 44592 TaxID=1292037 RepID=R1HQ02_9PSEU|nr:hypothetical protein H480_25790 [Amycolatopsis vancoresmycina DSM 44592]